MFTFSPRHAPSVRRIHQGRYGRVSPLLIVFVIIVGAARCTGCEASRAAVSAPPDSSAPAQPAVSTQATVSGWYTAAQADSGGQQYAASCAQCHGANLQGGAGPALQGSAFLAAWQGRTLSDLYSFEHSSMPLTSPGSLSDQQYADITAYILKANGFVAGSTPLTAGSGMSQILRPTPQALAVQQLASGMPAPDSAAPAGATSTANGAATTSDSTPAVVPVKMPSTDRPSQQELERADAAAGNWLTYNKGYEGRRYSALSTIDASNASRLRPVCMYQAGEEGTFEGGLVAYDGLLYGTTTNTTFAIDAASCREVWRHVYAPPGATYNNTNRGVAIAGGRVVRGTIDGHLIALDAKSGALLWDRRATNGVKGNFIAAPPLVR